MEGSFCHTFTGQHKKSEQTLDPQIVLSFSQCRSLISIVEVKANRENISVQHMP